MNSHDTNEVLVRMLDQLAEMNQLLDEQARTMRVQDARIRQLQQQLRQQKASYPTAVHSRISR